MMRWLRADAQNVRIIASSAVIGRARAHAPQSADVIRVPLISGPEGIYTVRTTSYTWNFTAAVSQPYPTLRNLTQPYPTIAGHDKLKRELRWGALRCGMAWHGRYVCIWSTVAANWIKVSDGRYEHTSHDAYLRHCVGIQIRMMKKAPKSAHHVCATLIQRYCCIIYPPIKIELTLNFYF